MTPLVGDSRVLAHGAVSVVWEVWDGVEGRGCCETRLAREEKHIGSGEEAGWMVEKKGRGWTCHNQSIPSLLPNRVTRQQAGKIMPAGAWTSRGGVRKVRGRWMVGARLVTSGSTNS